MRNRPQLSQSLYHLPLRGRSFLLLLFLFLCSQSAFSQTLIKKYNSAFGLSNNTVLRIDRDSSGFLWVGTYDGLNKFDGYDFYQYKLKASDAMGLSANYVSDFIDFGEKIYVATRNGLLALTKSSGAISKYLIDSTADLPFINNIHRVHSYPYEKNSILVISSAGVYRFSTRSNKFTKIIDDGYPKEAKELFYFSTIQDNINPDELWLGSIIGLVKINPAKKSFQLYKFKEFDIRNEQSSIVIDIMNDPADKNILWLATGEGITEFNKAAGTYKEYKFPRGAASPAGRISVYRLRNSMKEKNLVHVMTIGGGVFAFDIKERKYVPHKLMPHLMGSSSVTDIYEDESGIVWVGTIDGGMLSVYENTNSIMNFTTATEDLKLSSNFIYSVFESHRKEIWMVSSGSGIEVLDPVAKKVLNISPANSDLPTANISAIAPSLYDKNRIYYSAGASGYGYIDATTRKVYPFKVPLLPSNFMTSAVGEDARGNFWAIGPTQGVYLISPDRKRVIDSLIILPDSVRKSKNPPQDRLFGTRRITGAKFDKTGCLWITTLDKGLIKFDVYSGKTYNVAANPGNSKSLSHNVIQDVFLDDDGMFWVGTENGLNVIDPLKLTVERIDLPPVTGSNTIYSVTKDKKGFYWITSQSGLIKYDHKTKKSVTFNELDGFLEGFYIASTTASDGRIYMGSLAGMTIFDPEKVEINSRAPAVVITEFSFLNSGLTVNSIDPLLKRDESGMPVLELDYSQNSFALKFAGLNFLNPEQNRYSYMLENFDPAEILSEKRRYISYTNIEPGEYTLILKASNNSGIWNNQGLRIKIIVNPPFWRTTTAYLLYLLGFALIFAFVLSLQKRRIIKAEREKNMLKESELRARAAEAQAMAAEEAMKRKTQELEGARKLQLSMLPAMCPVLPRYRICGYMKTAMEVGGDYYDFKVDDEENFTCVIGDATGHGIKAGIMVSLIKWEFNSFSSSKNSADFFAKCSANIKELNFGNLFMSLSLLKFSSDSFLYSSAGMPPALLINSETGAITEILHKSMPLGAFKNFTYQETEVEFRSGDTLVLFTDGLSELFNETKEIFGFERLKEILQKNKDLEPSPLIDVLKEEIRLWTGTGEQNDDITIVVIKKTG